ncbi:uncharacterized protein PITG_21165 [Phytophthora infestans T30-4]|uniref:Uncharacterized protein n=1 Tax=Phytophthora infestans (strain T30-4) TaxID=403677 RepID=D0P3Z4_PHYIT|nr:uncharacterized protein PITG_21165 [Phytophthora infestans T30-4]EEY62131.1 conserved hypothetical protein [Phytophthora infestans T30-4]|eukprot:XP_002894980.1 conserved hypothetical protein [Phytophthora infestans T30-4]
MKELLLPNQNGMTAIQCAKTMNPLLATDIETCLLSRGVIVTQSSRGYVVASAISSSVGAPYLKRVDVRPNRFVACSSTASTVGLTLRANGIHYAAARAVYVQQVRSQALDELAFYGDKLLAFAASGTVGCDECRSVTTRSVAWSGSKIADLAKEATFRAKFDIFAPCKNASQQLVPGTSVMLDFAGKPEPKIAISYSGVRVPDAGYYDDDFLRGFRRGWFNIRENHDFGYDDMRVMIELPDEGIVFCRGVVFCLNKVSVFPAFRAIQSSVPFRVPCHIDGTIQFFSKYQPVNLTHTPRKEKITERPHRRTISPTILLSGGVTTFLRYTRTFLGQEVPKTWRSVERKRPIEAIKRKEAAARREIAKQEAEVKRKVAKLLCERLCKEATEKKKQNREAKAQLRETKKNEVLEARMKAKRLRERKMTAKGTLDKTVKIVYSAIV